MLHIGCHLSSSGGYLAMGKTALSLGANTFQFFTRNPRGSRAKEIDPEDTAALVRLMQEHDFAPILAHAPYTLNPASADPRIREFTVATMAEDLARMEYTPGNMYNFHPGCHVGAGDDAGIEQTADLLNQILRPEQTTTVLIETMAGKGSEIGKTFAEIRAMIDRVELNGHVGVCLDTCHVHDGGYPIRDALDDVLEEFDRVIGLSRLRAIHLNDSMNEREARKDRHAKIGEGKIGLDALETVINHPLLCRLPFYLETPNDNEGYAREIDLLRSLYRY